MHDNIEKTWPDTVHVRSHTAPLTGAFWWIVADNDSGLQIPGTQFFSDKEDAEEEAERINNIRPIEMLKEAAIESIPAKTDLVYIDYRDQLSDEQVKFLLAGDMEALWDSMGEWESDVRYEGVRSYWKEFVHTLDADERERIDDDDDAFDEFRDVCEERDESDWFDQLVRQTPPVMIRYYVDDHEVPDYTQITDEGDLEDEAREIAHVCGIDYEINKRELRSLVVNASYGGMLCVLHQTQLSDLINKGAYVEAVFTDPQLLVYDGLNGSGHMEQVTGTIRVKLDDDSMRLDVGSYSWSDGIAGIIHSCADTPVEFIKKEEDNNGD